MSSEVVAQLPSMQQRIKAFVEHNMVQRILLALILINAVILGMHARADNPELQQAQALGFKETEAGTLGSLAMIAFEEGRVEDSLALGKK